MRMSDIPFEATDWGTIESTEHAGESGMARWRTRHFGTIRVRMVEYPPPGTPPITGATRGTSCCALPAISRPSWPTAADSFSRRV